MKENKAYRTHNYYQSALLRMPSNYPDRCRVSFYGQRSRDRTLNCLAVGFCPFGDSFAGPRACLAIYVEFAHLRLQSRLISAYHDSFDKIKKEGEKGIYAFQCNIDDELGPGGVTVHGVSERVSARSNIGIRAFIEFKLRSDPVLGTA